VDSANNKSVSVVVPVFNDRKRIGKTIESLLSQNFPKHRLEIIVVDNGSEDGTPDLVSHYPVKLLLENQVRGHAAARNRGIKAANGEIIACTDSDCIAHPDWVRKAVEALIFSDASIVAGHIHFIFSKKRRAAEYFDAISHMQNWLSVPTRGIGTLANLFIHEKVFDDIGYFEESLLSGPDVFFTRMASQKGHKIVFCRDSIVYHPTRQLKSLLIKSIRVSKGKRRINKILKKNMKSDHSFPRQRKPWDYINPIILKKRLIKNGYEVGNLKFVQIFLICQIVLSFYLIDWIFGDIIETKTYG
jgi:glycosyltransferase involved in cell wall biosynthesis